MKSERSTLPASRSALLRITILGAGGFGTALAIALDRKGGFRDLFLWARDEAKAEELCDYRENQRYLPGVKIPGRVKITPHFQLAVQNADVLVLAVPSHGMRALCERLAKEKCRPRLLVNLAKGIEIPDLERRQPSGGAALPRRMSEVVAETLGKQAMQRYVALSGPGFAMELAQGLPMATTVASCSPVAVRLAQRLLMTERYRVYTSTDVVGVELGGALKNVMAIAAGMSDGIGYGDSAKAALMTRGLVEMSRLGVAMGGRVGTFYGLSGLGDLVATCFSQKSRNRGVGERLGRGETLSQIQASMTMVAEGVRTAKAAREMAKKSTGRAGIETPIIDEINAILYKGKSPKLAVQDLMTRTARAE